MDSLLLLNQLWRYALVGFHSRTVPCVQIWLYRHWSCSRSKIEAGCLEIATGVGRLSVKASAGSNGTAVVALVDSGSRTTQNVQKWR